jgi:hypothetical protein
MIETIATVATDQPERYLKQLVNHLAHKLSTGFGDDGSGEIVLDVGSCRLVAQPGALVLTAQAADDEGLARVCDVVGRHLERFGSRDGLQVHWERPAQPV